MITELKTVRINIMYLKVAIALFGHQPTIQIYSEAISTSLTSKILS